MADPNVGQVVASVWEVLMTDKPTDSIFSSQGLLYLLNEEGFKETAAGGRLFECSVLYAVNTTFKSYSELETLDTTRIDVFDAARYDQKIVAGTIVFSDLELVRNQVANRKFDILEQKLENGKMSHGEALNTQLYSNGSGNGGKDFDGLAKIISSTPTTGVVGGIDAGTFTFWRNRQNSGTTGSTSGTTGSTSDTAAGTGTASGSTSGSGSTYGSGSSSMSSPSLRVQSVRAVSGSCSGSSNQ